jgi:hypothetical protein
MVQGERLAIKDYCSSARRRRTPLAKGSVLLTGRDPGQSLPTSLLPVRHAPRWSSGGAARTIALMGARASFGAPTVAPRRPPSSAWPSRWMPWVLSPQRRLALGVGGPGNLRVFGAWAGRIEKVAPGALCPAANTVAWSAQTRRGGSRRAERKRRSEWPQAQWYVQSLPGIPSRALTGPDLTFDKALALLYEAHRAEHSKLGQLRHQEISRDVGNASRGKTAWWRQKKVDLSVKLPTPDRTCPETLALATSGRR